MGFTRRKKTDSVGTFLSKPKSPEGSGTDSKPFHGLSKMVSSILADLRCWSTETRVIKISMYPDEDDDDDHYRPTSSSEIKKFTSALASNSLTTAEAALTRPWYTPAEHHKVTPINLPNIRHHDSQMLKKRSTSGFQEVEFSLPGQPTENDWQACPALTATPKLTVPISQLPKPTEYSRFHDTRSNTEIIREFRDTGLTGYVKAAVVDESKSYGGEAFEVRLSSIRPRTAKGQRVVRPPRRLERIDKDRCEEDDKGRKNAEQKCQEKQEQAEQRRKAFQEERLTKKKMKFFKNKVEPGEQPKRTALSNQDKGDFTGNERMDGVMSSCRDGQDVSKFEDALKSNVEELPKTGQFTESLLMDSTRVCDDFYDQPAANTLNYYNRHLN